MFHLGAADQSEGQANATLLSATHVAWCLVHLFSEPNGYKSGGVVCVVCGVRPTRRVRSEMQCEREASYDILSADQNIKLTRYE